MERKKKKEDEEEEEAEEDFFVERASIREKMMEKTKKYHLKRKG